MMCFIDLEFFPLCGSRLSDGGVVDGLIRYGLSGNVGVRAVKASGMIRRCRRVCELVQGLR